MTTRGLHVALMGIDGIGKTTFVADLARMASAQGIAVRRVTWRSAVEEPTSPLRFPTRELRMLWLQSFRAYFGGATGADGAPIDLPESYEQLHERGTEYLNGLPIRDMPPSGALASAWIELTANTLLHLEVIQPMVAEGCLVLQETYGYKHLVKLFALVEDISPAMAEAARLGHELAFDYFGRVLQPDVGIYLAGSPTLALRWRQRQSQLGTFEKLVPTAERDPESAFLLLQERATAAFDTFADTYSWSRADIVDASREENRRRILDAVSGTALADKIDLAAAVR